MDTQNLISIAGTWRGKLDSEAGKAILSLKNKINSAQGRSYATPQIFEQSVQIFVKHFLDNPSVTNAQIIAMDKVAASSIKSNDAKKVEEKFKNYADYDSHQIAVNIFSFITGAPQAEISNQAPDLGFTGTPDKFLLAATIPALILGTILHDVTDYLKDAGVVGINKALWGFEGKIESALAMAYGAFLQESQPTSELGQFGTYISDFLVSQHIDNDFATQLFAQAATKTFGSVVLDRISNGTFPANTLYKSLYDRFPGNVISTGESLIKSAVTGAISRAIGAKDPLSQLGISTVLWGPSPIEIGSFAGSQLYQKMIGQWNILSEDISVKGAQYGGSLGTTLSAASLALASNPVSFPVAVVVAAVSTLLGSILGGEFGDKDYPRAAFDVILDPNSREFKSVFGYAEDGAPSDGAQKMGEYAKDMLNLLIGNIGGLAEQTNGLYAYGFYEKQYIFHRRDLPGGSTWGAWVKFNSAEEAVTSGIIQQLKATPIEGGDLYMKRTLANISTATFDYIQVPFNYLALVKNLPTITLQQLNADFLVAKEYGLYQDNPALYVRTLTNLREAQFRESEAKILEMQAKGEQPVFTADAQFYNFGTNVLPSQVTLRLEGNDLIVNGQRLANWRNNTTYQVFRFADGSLFKPVINTDGSVTLQTEQFAKWQDALKRAQELSLDTVRSSDTYASGQVSRFIGGDGADILISKPGTETLEGKLGDDVYVYTRGSGTDTIIDAGGFDVIEFDASIRPEDLQLQQRGQDLVIGIGNSTDQLIIQDFATLSKRIELLRFGNNTEYQIDASSWQAAINFSNFTNTSSLTFNGSANRVSDVLRLTSNQANQSGSAFYATPISLSNNTSFQTSFQFQITGGRSLREGVIGSDGFVFMLQNAPQGSKALGGIGYALGYGSITNSFAIEFDTNGQATGDPNDNHIGIDINGSLVSTITATPNLNLKSGAPIYAWIDYNGVNNQLQVYLSNTAIKPGTALLTTTVDLPNIVGNQAYIGFSAGTGSLWNNHDIRNWQFNSSDGKSLQLTPAQTTLIGTNQSETLTGTFGADTIVGGLGNDTLKGGAGNDTYRYARGNGKQTIHDTGDFEGIVRDGGVDVLEFGAGITPGNLLLQFQGKDLIVGIRTADAPNALLSSLTDTITIKDWLKPNSKIETFRFANGIELKPQQMMDGSATLQPILSQGNSTLSSQLDPTSSLVISDRLVVLDLTGDGIQLVPAAQSSAMFDLDGDGYLEQTAWVAPTDGFLVLDRNNDGLITQRNEFFSLANQVGVPSLTSLDSNSDGIINANDSLFNQLRIWTDYNQNGQTDLGEIVALHRYGILEISTNAQTKNYSIAGNPITAEAYFTRLGLEYQRRSKLYDVAFVYNSNGVKLETLGSGWAGFNFENKPNVLFADGSQTNLTLVIDPTTTYSVTGGKGNDQLSIKESGSASKAILNGGEGNDLLVGASGDDVLVGGAGRDSLSGGAGDDMLTIDRDDPLGNVSGGSGFDTLIIEGLGDFTINLSQLNIEAIVGSVGNDRFTATGTASVVLSGGAGNDYLAAGSGSDRLEGGDGNDTLLPGLPGLGIDIVDGGAGRDRLVIDYSGYSYEGKGIKNPQADRIQTISGEWTLISYSNIEQFSITGTTYGDELYGGSLDDSLSGGNGNDILRAGAGGDLLQGNNGNDILDGGTGADTLIGDIGNDIYVVDQTDDVITEISTLPAEIDTVLSSITYTLGANLENLILAGTAVIAGIGNALNNTITGNSATNVLSGGAGNDRLTGGGGVDGFLYSTNKAFASRDIGIDTIVDFVSGTDKIVISSKTFTALRSSPGNGFRTASEFATVTSNVAVAGSGALFVYNRNTGELFYNQNRSAAGLGTGGKFATLSTRPNLTGNDFMIQA